MAQIIDFERQECDRFYRWAYFCTEDTRREDITDFLKEEYIAFVDTIIGLDDVLVVGIDWFSAGGIFIKNGIPVRGFSCNVQCVKDSILHEIMANDKNKDAE